MSIQTWIEQGNAFLELDTQQDALECFNQAITLNPAHILA